MLFEFAVDNLLRRAATAVAALVLCAVLASWMWSSFVAGLLTDERVAVTKDWLDRGKGYAPNSALVEARLARVEMLEEERDIEAIRSHAVRAINISPWDFNHRLLLASIEEARGDREAAERSLRDAVGLAPNNTEVHWRLANSLFRLGKYRESLAEFRLVTNSNREYLPAALDMMWRASNGNLAAVEAVTPPDARSRLALSEYLLKQSRVSEAARVFDSIDRTARLTSGESEAIINRLISMGEFEMARALWINIVGGKEELDGGYRATVWNGSFESGPSPRLAQFDWATSSSNFAAVAIESGGRTGSRALKIDFLGRDTTRLDNEVRQIVLVRPAARYRLSFYAKTEGLVTTEGPRIVLEDRRTGAAVAQSEPIAAGTADWQMRSVDFTAPAGASALVITIKRIPRFSYDEPMRGTLWLDDFALNEQGGNR
ncbi:MAG TPA: tetratricopeptide repeat protein [Blastocatellia bacterium]|nr:tetratricopeptide repeat protein [Blastocatellia bacterium]